jgi:hypothetical protein
VNSLRCLLYCLKLYFVASCTVAAQWCFGYCPDLKAATSSILLAVPVSFRIFFMWNFTKAAFHPKEIGDLINCFISENERKLTEDEQDEKTREN